MRRCGTCDSVSQRSDSALIKPRAMLIDLDDTIIDYRSGVLSCWREVCAYAARDVPGLDPEVLFREICSVRDWYWSDPVRHKEGRADMRAARSRVANLALQGVGFDLSDFARDLGWMYQELRDERATLIPGAVDALQRFRTEGIRLALITKRDWRSAEREDRALRFGAPPRTVSSSKARPVLVSLSPKST